MKRFAVILVLIVGILISGCGGKNTMDSASPSSFLADMARGIETRNDNIDDPEDPSIEELAAYYKKLVTYELNIIGKYDGTTFGDSKFDQLAHSYIDACKLQMTATDNYRSEDLFYALWDAGRAARASLIVEFYEKYDLQISSELASTYRSPDDSGAGNVSVSVDTSGNDILNLLDLDPNDVSLKKGDIRITGCTATKQTPRYSFNGDYVIEYTLKNESDYPVVVNLELVQQDKDGNNLKPYRLTSVVEIPAGKEKTLSNDAKLEESAFCLIPYKLTIDGNRNSIYKGLSIEESDIEKYTLYIYK